VTAFFILVYAKDYTALSYLARMEEPKIEDILDKIQSSSRVVFRGQLAQAVIDAVDKEHYKLAGDLRDLYKKEFQEDLPDLELLQKLFNLPLDKLLRLRRWM
jgi:hypothetical protein